MNSANEMNVEFDSVAKNNEQEVVARNIMVILSRAGDEFREMTWQEYKDWRVKEGRFTESEHSYFDRAVKFCRTAETAACFSQVWGMAYDDAKKNSANDAPSLPGGLAGLDDREIDMLVATRVHGWRVAEEYAYSPEGHRWGRQAWPGGDRERWLPYYTKDYNAAIAAAKHMLGSISEPRT